MTTRNETSNIPVPEQKNQWPELNNKLIFLGQQVTFGALLPEHVAECIATDKQLAQLPDDQLWSLIEEADRYWRERLHVALTQPGNVATYPLAMVACAQARLKAIGHFRQGVKEPESEALDRRMDLWITRTSRCLAGRGMALLLRLDFEGSWETFTQANICARGLPDSGQLRLREVLAACYGQWLAANMGRQPELIQAAEQEINGLLQAPSRQQEATAYWNKILQDFKPFQEIIEQKLLAQQPSGENAQAGQVLNQTDYESASDDPVTYAMYYVEQLNLRAGKILSGQENAPQAHRQLVESVDLRRLGAKEIYFISIWHRQLAQGAPERAIILADLNYAVSCALTGPQATLTRAYCAFALADAHSRRAWQDKDEAGLRQAIPFFEEALPILDAEGGEESRGDAADITVGLASCYRLNGDFAKAQSLVHDAIHRLQDLPERRSQLGVAYGNLAMLQEKTGELPAAVDNHYKAFQIFLEAKDSVHARQALTELSRPCQKLGRLDDAAAATQQAVALLVELADIEGAVTMLLLLADQMQRLRRYREWLLLLQQAEDLLLPQLPSPPGMPNDPDWTAHLIESVPSGYLPLYIDILVWRGTTFTMLLKEPSGRFTLEQAFEWLETARQIAAGIGDYNLLAKTITQLASLFAQAGKFEDAEQFCHSLDLIPCSPLQKQRGEEILGHIRLKQKQYPEAIELLKRMAAAYGPDRKERKSAVLHHLGQAYEEMGDLPEAVRYYEAALDVFEQSRLDLYESSRIEIMGYAEDTYNHLILLYSDSTNELFNPQAALVWLEKSKSRTFTEIMGLSPLPWPETPTKIQAELEEESRLLQQINALRTQLFLSPTELLDRVATQQAMQDCLVELEQLWSKMLPHCPEYVELRRGNPVDWQEMQQILQPASG